MWTAATASPHAGREGEGPSRILAAAEFEWTRMITVSEIQKKLSTISRSCAAYPSPWTRARSSA